MRLRGWHGDRYRTALLLLGGVLALALPLLVIDGRLFFGLRKALIAPAPASVLDTEWVPRLPSSTLNVPITYDLGEVIEQLEGAVDYRYGSIDERHELESRDRVDVAYEFTRNRFRARLIGDVAHVGTTITYQAKGWYDPPLLPEIGASCGMEDDDGPPPRLNVALSARLSLTENWELDADAQIDAIGPLTEEDRDKCRVTPLNVDMTEHVVSAALEALVERLPRIERSLASIDLRSKFERWWTVLFDPIELAPEVWLTINPESVHRGPVVGEGQQLVASVGLTARPAIVLGSRPQIRPLPLPQLDSTGVDEGLRIHATGKADYREISAQLNTLLAGHTLERDGRTLVIEQLRVRGIGAGRLSLEVEFHGTATGRLYLVGTPEFDQSSGRVHVPDLNLDVASSSLLVNSYAWLQEQGITELLREQARWPVTDLAAIAEAQLAKGLNRFLTDGVELKGVVNSVDIVGVFAMQNEFIVHAQANATGELLISSDAGPRSAP